MLEIVQARPVVFACRDLCHCLLPPNQLTRRSAWDSSSMTALFAQTDSSIKTYAHRAVHSTARRGVCVQNQDGGTVLIAFVFWP